MVKQVFFFCFNCFQNQAKQTRTSIYFHQNKLQARPGCLQSALGMRQLHHLVQYWEITKVVCWIMVCQTTIHVSCFNCLSNYDSMDKRGHSFCMFLCKKRKINHSWSAWFFEKLFSENRKYKRKLHGLVFKFPPNWIFLNLSCGTAVSVGLVFKYHLRYNLNGLHLKILWTIHLFCKACLLFEASRFLYFCIRYFIHLCLNIFIHSLNMTSRKKCNSGFYLLSYVLNKSCNHFVFVYLSLRMHLAHS